jgi:acetyl-CoA carboxylase carboxyl transferase subunit beta
MAVEKDFSTKRGAPQAQKPQAQQSSSAAPAKPARAREGWLSKIAPGVRRLVTKREAPDNLWVKCPDTGEMIYRPDLEAALWVTPAGRHMRIGADLRFAYTFDGGVHDDIDAPHAPDDPLHFVDLKPYRDRLAAARKETGERDAVSIAAGEIHRVPAVVMVQDFAFIGGSLSMGVGEAFVAATKAAVERDAPLVAFAASGGARMQEGALALMQMARTTLAIQDLKKARLPYLVVLTDPTYGGVTASYAMLGDIQLAEPGALVGFTGPRIIEQTIRETLPPGFQRAEYLVEKGMIDKVVRRKELPEVIGRVLSTLMLGRSRRSAA